MENHHRHTGFPNETWWFSIVMLVYQRVHVHLGMILTTTDVAWIYDEELVDVRIAPRISFRKFWFFGESLGRLYDNGWIPTTSLTRVNEPLANMTQLGSLTPESHMTYSKQYVYQGNRKKKHLGIYIYNENTRYHHPTIIRHSMHWACKPLWKWGHDHSLRWDKKTTLVQETNTCPILDTQSSEFSRLEFRIPSR